MNPKIDNEVAEMLLKGINNMHEYFLEKNTHIKEYYKWRKIHSEILDSMSNYIWDGKFNLGNKLNNIENDLIKEVNGNRDIITIDLNLRNDLENRLFIELNVYKNHPKMVSVTEEYIAKNKFKNKEKLELLNAMNDSFISYFEIINKDKNGYVDLIDLVTGEKYQIIDISLSSPISKNNCYLYSRIISLNDIKFTCPLFAYPKNNKKINNYIKNLKDKRKSNIIKTLEAYNLYQKYGVDIKLNNI